ncbi:hypothetical protein [Arsenicicoccus piscis]|uniref:Uncharacterized protein n=1 Tax=Arsenicicoccus piscis TaxID=673954 RepID=A0ABQ6HSW7_9MICO|nr:hypothetical protein [Arsenicicoccus piscis]GMA20640.1 hypothetical protein GCM10025862_26610 [Arsenicicoccus piscis]
MSVQPSSLVFVVLIAVWAAYVLQSWMRRRENLETARTVDVLTDAMRVLERRQPVPTGSPSHPRSYVASPLRTRPRVSVPTPSSPLTSAPTRATSSALGRAFSPRRLRAYSLVVLVAALVASVVAAAFHLVGWVVPAIVGIALVADLAVLRTLASRQPRIRLRERSAPRVTESAPVASSPDVEAAPVAETVAVVESPAESASVLAPVSERAPEPAVDRVAEPAGSTVFDVRSYDEPAPTPAVAQQPAEPLEPGQWRPAPVPTPTYLLKPSAPQRPVVAEPVAQAAPRLASCRCRSRSRTTSSTTSTSP